MLKDIWKKKQTKKLFQCQSKLIWQNSVTIPYQESKLKL